MKNYPHALKCWEDVDERKMACLRRLLIDLSRVPVLGKIVFKVMSRAKLYVYTLQHCNAHTYRVGGERWRENKI